MRRWLGHSYVVACTSAKWMAKSCCFIAANSIHHSFLCFSFPISIIRSDDDDHFKFISECRSRTVCMLNCSPFWLASQFFTHVRVAVPRSAAFFVYVFFSSFFNLVQLGTSRTWVIHLLTSPLPIMLNASHRENTLTTRRYWFRVKLKIG